MPVYIVHTNNRHLNSGHISVGYSDLHFFAIASLVTILWAVVWIMGLPEPPITNQLPHGPCFSSRYFTEKYCITFRSFAGP